LTRLACQLIYLIERLKRRVCYTMFSLAVSFEITMMSCISRKPLRLLIKSDYYYYRDDQKCHSEITSGATCRSRLLKQLFYLFSNSCPKCAYYMFVLNCTFGTVIGISLRFLLTYLVYEFSI